MSVVSVLWAVTFDVCEELVLGEWYLMYVV